MWIVTFSITEYPPPRSGLIWDWIQPYLLLRCCYLFVSSISLLILLSSTLLNHFIFVVGLLCSTDLSFALWFSLKFFLWIVEFSSFTFINWIYMVLVVSYCYSFCIPFKVFYYINSLLCFLCVGFCEVSIFVPIVIYICNTPVIQYPQWSIYLARLSVSVILFPKWW